MPEVTRDPNRARRGKRGFMIYQVMLFGFVLFAVIALAAGETLRLIKAVDRVDTELRESVGQDSPQ